ncbi:hypothetical protein N7468_008926 [Penicillium chermesinum]|uniref:Major facilitator superfamily (MFS) profile domain-containing protein n=1 Tax=Penicillium chermesinum TaxID=63820 RepID=A0A9W9TEC9_9EURO|nr:uncharacterized protein N7468_008926 [Penicillium chermesinum]KAJ5219722.1 hypothetical protein N7468_008926 [Penicillium chermesinum]KAJ6153721.1 hypothetical protein N7470_006680 [Penicillium chermesinum]
MPEENTNTTTMWPPGTVHLVESNASNGKDIVLHPRPSEDPNDPLNWAPSRKYWNMGLVCFYVAMVGEFINANTPTWGPMETELGFTSEILNDSYAAGCAALGVGSVILIPFALRYGRRPLYLFSTVVQFGVSIWSAKMRTVGDLMGVNILQCFFGSLAEAIVQMTIADLFFVHQRGRMNALYVWTWLLSGYLGILIAGFVASSLGWRWIWWLNAIVFGVTIFVVGFGYEETKYCAPTMVPTVITNGIQTGLTHEGRRASSHPAEQDAKGTPEEPAKELYTENNKTVDSDIDLELPNECSSRGICSTTINPGIPMKSYRERLALFTLTPSSNDSFYRHIYQPMLILTTIPAVAWTALVYGILVALGDVMSTTMSSYLPGPPYNFSSYQVGLMSIPRVIGVTIGAVIVGPLSDWTVLALSKRRKGIFEPEMRLWCIAPFVPFIVAGALLFAIGLNNQRPWPIIAVGLVLYNIGVTPINTLTIAYVTDSYKDIVGEALVAVTFIRNMFSTAFIFALTPWVAKVGLLNTFVTILVIAVAIIMGFIVFLLYGKALRRIFASRYRRYAGRQYKDRFPVL